MAQVAAHRPPLPVKSACPLPPWGSCAALRAFLAGITLAVLPACAEESGFVELNWVFVDNTVRNALFPGERADTCDLKGQSGDETARYDMSVQLTISTADCETFTTDPECLVARETFSCTRARASLTDIPASSDAGYRMDVDVVINPRSGAPFVPDPDCVSVPGTRIRHVDSGSTVDLSVYQLIVHAIDPNASTTQARRLDLVGCKPGA